MKIRPTEANLFNQDERADGQTDMKKLIVALRNFANAPKIANSRQFESFIVCRRPKGRSIHMCLQPTFLLQLTHTVGLHDHDSVDLYVLNFILTDSAEIQYERRATGGSPKAAPLSFPTVFNNMGHLSGGRVETESGGTRRSTGGEVKGKEANGVGSQQSSA